jgi:hypothetical protein
VPTQIKVQVPPIRSADLICHERKIIVLFERARRKMKIQEYVRDEIASYKFE